MAVFSFPRHVVFRYGPLRLAEIGGWLLMICLFIIYNFRTSNNLNHKSINLLTRDYIVVKKYLIISISNCVGYEEHQYLYLYKTNDYNEHPTTTTKRVALFKKSLLENIEKQSVISLNRCKYVSGVYGRR